MFADLGHFGRVPIRLAWYGVVLPALLLNYFGQGALVLEDAAAAANPFFLLMPAWGLPALVVLATAATVIASQAVISGSFSVVHQAVRLSYIPRLLVRYSSEHSFGQVFVPMANAVLAITTVLLVLGFGSSESLAGAYGIAIAAAMAIDSVLVLVWLAQRDAASPARGTRALLAVMVLMLLVDGVFLFGNSQKVFDGGWVPVLLAAALFLVMNTWTRGRDVVRNQIAIERYPVQDLRRRLENKLPVRVPGTAVFLASNPNGLPHALWHNLEFNDVLHERVVLLTMLTEEVPRVPGYRRMEIAEVLPGITRVVARFGFMETPVVNDILYEASRQGVEYKLADAVFFVGSESVFYGRSRLRDWEKRLFAFMIRNSRRAASFYGVPDARLVEIGTRLSV